MSTSMNVEVVNAQVKRLLNAQLKVLCKACVLQVSGAKATLQQRLLNHVQHCASTGNVDGFNRVRHLVFHPEEANRTQFPTPSAGQRAPSFPVDTRQPPATYQTYGSAPSPRPPMSSTIADDNRTVNFKHSPFYNVTRSLTPVRTIKVREQTRDQMDLEIRLPEDVVGRLTHDTNARVMIFCAAESLGGAFTRFDIAFPQQIEIRVNGDEVKHNFRGLKNKLGSTRPADITKNLRVKTGFVNPLHITWALTNKKFYLVANLIQLRPVVELVRQIRAGNNKISKERVISEMKRNADDNEIETTSTNLSLKCPLSTLRITDPCRSSVCTHNQCFDLTSFLQLQEQAPTWTCPVCNKIFSFDSLQLDMYMDDILKSTPDSVDQVTVDPLGKWSSGSGDPSDRRKSGVRSETSSDDEDLVEIQEPSKVNGIKREAVTESILLSTPPTSVRSEATSTNAAHPKTSSNKRPASQVVDLTLSSDDEEEPVRPPKRQALSSNPTRTPSANSIPVRTNSGSHIYTTNPFPPTSHSYNRNQPM